MNGLVNTDFVTNDGDCFSQTKIYLNKYILSYCEESGILKSYNLKGDLLSETIFDDKMKNSALRNLNKEVCFIKNNKFYIF